MGKRFVPLMTKITWMFSAIIVFACILLSVLFYRLNTQAYISELTTQNTALLRTITQNINAQLAQVEIITQEIAYDDDVIRLLCDKSISRQILSISFSVGEKLQRNETYLSGLSTDLVVLSIDDNTLESYDTLIHESRFNNDTFYADFLKESVLSKWGYPEEIIIASTTKYTVLPYYHKVILGMNNRIGTVRCTIRMDKLFAPLTGISNNAAIVLRDSKEIFSVGSEMVLPKEIHSGCWQEGENLYFSTVISKLDAILVMCVPFNQIRIMTLRSIAISTISVFLVGIILLVVTKQMLKAVLSRLHKLTEVVKTIPDNSCGIILPEDGPDEVGTLSRAFNCLLEQVNSYYNEMLQEEKDKRHAQTMALQYQLNPHFLFNSLYWLQLQMEEQNVDASLTASIEQLGLVLHYNMLGSRLALLSEEEEHVLAYVGFVGAMKENHIYLSMNMPENIRNLQILRFTLQPLLENAIQHGYIPGSDLHLRIDFLADQSSDLLEIAVHNDGKQIPADALSEIQERVDAASINSFSLAGTKNGHGTALKNLSRRLVLTYGESARLLVDSDEMDTCIRIHFPLHRCTKKESNFESTNC